MKIDTNYILNVEANYIYGRRNGLSDDETEQIAQETYSKLEMMSEKFEAKKPLERPPFKSFGRCPNCKENISINTDKNNCGKCGQAIDWEVQHAKES